MSQAWRYPWKVKYNVTYLRHDVAVNCSIHFSIKLDSKLWQELYMIDLARNTDIYI